MELYVFDSEGYELDGPFTSRAAAEAAADTYEGAYVDTLEPVEEMA
jgi:hypothetical protein